MPSVSSGDLTPAQSAEISKANVDPEENLYRCHQLTGGAKYPGTIVEAPGLANIKSPRPSYFESPHTVLSEGFGRRAGGRCYDWERKNKHRIFLNPEQEKREVPIRVKIVARLRLLDWL